MPKKTPEPEQAPKADNYAKINMPAAFLTLEKGRATVSFKKDEPVPIWTGKKDDAEHPYQRYEVKATDLTHALKVAQDSYKAEKAAERAAAKDGVSLAGEARDMETGKDALAGDDPAKSTKSRTGQDIAQ